MRTLTPKALEDCDHIFIDIDGLVYKIVQEVKVAFAKAAARVFLRHAPEKYTFEEAENSAWRSWDERGLSTELFAEENHLDKVLLLKEYLEECRKDISIIPVDETLQPDFEKFSHYCDATGKDFSALTHGTRSWACAVLTRQGVRGYFSRDRICDFEVLDGEKKSDSTKPFDEVTKRKKVRPARAMMMDDKPENLFMAKQAGLVTVWISHGEKIDLEKHPYIDYVATNLHEFFKAVGVLDVSLPKARVPVQKALCQGATVQPQAKRQELSGIIL